MLTTLVVALTLSPSTAFSLTSSGHRSPLLHHHLHLRPTASRHLLFSSPDDDEAPSDSGSVEEEAKLAEEAEVAAAEEAMDEGYVEAASLIGIDAPEPESSTATDVADKSATAKELKCKIFSLCAAADRWVGVVIDNEQPSTYSNIVPFRSHPTPPQGLCGVALRSTGD